MRPPIADPNLPPEPIEENQPFGYSYAAIARAQKLVIWSIIASIVIYIWSKSIISSPDSEDPTVQEIVFGVAAILTTLFNLVSTFLLAKALKLRPAWLSALFTLIPLVGFIYLLSLNRQATKKLRGAGFHVGILGAKGKIPA